MTKAWRDGFSAAARRANVRDSTRQDCTVIEMIRSSCSLKAATYTRLKILIERATIPSTGGGAAKAESVLSRSLRRLGDSSSVGKACRSRTDSSIVNRTGPAGRGEFPDETHCRRP